MPSVRIFQLSLTFTCLLAAGLCPGPGIAQIAHTEIHPIQTTTPTDEEFLTGVKDSRTTTIAGVLRIPQAGTDRLPAVILVHGSGGMGGNLDYWSHQLTASGIATFAIDYLTGRGIENTNADQGKLSPFSPRLAIYHALAPLASHPPVHRTPIA